MTSGRARAGGRRWWAVAAGFLAVGLAASACGLPYDSSPREIPGPLPASLTSPDSSSTTQPQETTTSLSHGTTAYFYYVQDQELLSLPQPVPAPIQISEVLKTLEDGPSIGQVPTQSGGPVTTDLPVGSNLQSLGILHGVAHVQLDNAYIQLGSSEQAVLELGQIVYTLTASLGVSAVQFYAPNGSAAPVVNASGQIVTGAVKESDYCAETETGCGKAKTTTTTMK